MCDTTSKGMHRLAGATTRCQPCNLESTSCLSRSSPTFVVRALATYGLRLAQAVPATKNNTAGAIPNKIPKKV